MSVSLRPYQQDAVERIRASYRAGKRAPLFVLPTGGGKSIILSYIAHSVASKGRRVVVQAHRIELVRQLSAALDKVGCSHGFIAAGYKECLSESVQIASVDTLARRIAKNPHRYKFDLAVQDEAHHLVRGNKWGKIIEAFPEAKILGVTATAQRLSGEGLGAHASGYFDDLIVGPSIKDLIGIKALVPIKVYAPPLADMDGVKIRHGEYDATQSAARVDKPTITGSAIEHYKRLCNGKRAIVFAANIAHSQHIAEQFNQAGVPARHVDSNTPADEREAAMRDYRAGRVLVLVNVELYGEGVDVSSVSAIIMLRATASLTMFMQMIGRAMRPDDGKEHGILLDHVANVARHSMPDEDRIWTLDGKAAKKAGDEEPAIQRMKMCQHCYRMVPVYQTKCEECGTPFLPSREQPKQTEGELVEITEAQKEQMRRQAKSEVARARTREELEAVARARGYASGWVRIMMQARQRRSA